MMWQRIRLFITIFIVCCGSVRAAETSTQDKKESRPQTKNELAEYLVRQLKPLKYPRGQRLPLYVWATMDLEPADDAVTERILKQLDETGIAVTCSWQAGDREKSLAEGLRVAALQKKLGLPVNVNATSCLHAFFNGDQSTAHIDENGKPFFDDSFPANGQMGCPFALQHRYAVIKEQIEPFLRAYKEKGLPIDFIFADWEIDGPIEWNGAWASSKRCTRCRQNIKNIDDFGEFQKAVRTIRCDIQKRVYADTVKAYFPKTLVGNYAVYPNDGWRYWYDFFEEYVDGAPCKQDGRAKYRQWFDEFPRCGYTFAMPILYTWSRLYSWYDFENSDYRWFYNLLLIASNAGRHTSADVPIISFVNHSPLGPAKESKDIKPFSDDKYREVLWHMLLRGHDTFFVYCGGPETLRELGPVHEVYAAALEYKEFLDKGIPISFDVPKSPGPVVSGLRLGNRVLVRRTDFDDNRSEVTVVIEGKKLRIVRADGACQILKLPE